MMCNRLLTAALFLGIIGSALPARADIAIGAGINGNFGVNNGANKVNLPSSWGLSGLLGYRIRLAELELTPEFELQYLDSVKSLANEHINWAFKASAGGRLGLRLGSWVPAAYVHFGLGDVRLEGNLPRRTKTGPTVEVGGSLDYRLIDAISLGVQVGYSAMRISDVEADVGSFSMQWLRAGAHLGIYF